MTQLRDIQPGSVLRAKDGRGEFIVTANHGDRLTLVRVIELSESSASNWRMVASPHPVLAVPLEIEKNS